MNLRIIVDTKRGLDNRLHFISIISFVTLIIFYSHPSPLQADIIFPARIELKEKAAGEFDVLFTLPIINNKKLKAELQLPSICREVTERKISTSYTSYIETWTVACNPQELFGESIEIKGLRGTYVEIMLMIEMLDGRVYSTTLKPSRASFTIPQAPSIVDLILNSSYLGARRIVTQPVFYLLLFILVFFISQQRILLFSFVAFLISHLISQYLAQEQLIKLSPFLSQFIILNVVLFPAFDLVQGKPALRRWFQPLWLFAVILGFLSGGSRPETLALPGLSYSEQHIVSIGINLGIALGLLLVYFFLKEFKKLLTMFVLRTKPHRAHIILGYMIGLSTSSLLFYYGTTFLITSNILPEVSLEFFIFPFLFGYWFWQTSSPKTITANGIFLFTMSMGLIVGGLGYSIPLGSTILFAGILFFCSQILFEWNLSEIANRVIAGIAVFAYGWTAGQTILDNLTLPIANTVGYASLAVFLFFFGYSFLTVKPDDNHPMIAKILAGVAALIILLFRINEYKILFDREISTSMAMGQLAIPLLSVLLLIGTLLMWPRKRKIHQHLDLDTKKPIRHWAIICIAFLVLPFFHVLVSNPFFESHALQGDEAKLVLQNVLSNTYHAFNVKDEDELYQELAENVTGDLVANIYLDSRRRLTAGVRQGAEVSVRDVSVISVGDLIEGTNPADGFSYESKWSVTARVKHLQHIHHRKNIYSGILKIKVEDNAWKISHIELQSEDRMIVTGIQG